MKFLIGANLKMNKNSLECTDYLENLVSKYVAEETTELLVTPVSVELCIASKILKDSDIFLGAQNMYFEEQGTFTGEISPTMLADFNCEYVLIGHSERRKYFGETNEMINKKVLSAIAHNIRPILCIGESLEQKNKGLTKEVLKIQMIEGLWGVEDFSQVDIAYEPIWAIGTGETATPEYVEEIHDFMRELVGDNGKTRILYGGSVKPENACKLSKIKNLNGFLIGGACLDAGSLMDIVGEVNT